MRNEARQLPSLSESAYSRFRSRPMPVVVAVALIVQCSVFALRVNGQIQNPGFESGSFSGWQTFGPVLTVAPITPHAGTYSAAIAGQNTGSPNSTGFFQNIATTDGVTWVASAWARHNTVTAITGTANACLLKIEFYRIPNGAYGSPDMLAEYSVVMVDGATAVDAWAQHTLQAVSPADTVEARIAIVFNQQNDDPGAVVIDDVSAQNDAPLQPGWDVIWADEFDDPAIDTSKWRIEDIHPVKNNELQYYAPDDVYQTTVDSRTVMTLRSQQRQISGFDNQGNFGTWNYSSGLVDTRDRFAMVYGRFEVGAQLPGTKGMWPAHWGLASDGGWPPEIDIMELIGQIPWVTHMSLHWGPIGPNGEPPWEIGQTVSTTYAGPDFTAGFHEFAVEWRPGLIQWFVDGVVRQTSTNSNIPAVPFYWILNTAVGGDWPGTPDGSTVFPQYHYIDYVRAYVPSDPGPALIDMNDTTRTAGTVDGVISPGEYPLSTSGINNGAGDLIGAGSTMHVDTDSAGNLLLGFDNASAWPTGATQTVVVYVDSVSGGSVSTYELTDGSDAPRRAISGKAASGQRGDLFFPLGVRADYAICLLPNLVGVYRIDQAGHEFVHGAFFNADTDIYGGDEVSYLGSSDQRELRIRLNHIGAKPFDALRLFANVFDTSSGARFNEFVGASAGNPWDGGNTPVGTSTVMKPGDFLRLQTPMPTVMSMMQISCCWQSASRVPSVGPVAGEPCHRRIACWFSTLRRTVIWI